MSRFARVKAACYTSNVSMSVISALSPLLFITFRSTYGISYSLLGLLVLINFISQLVIDTIFSFFSHKFNIPLTVKLIPLICLVGLVIYAVYPVLFPDSAYVGLVIGTIIFSISGGLGEVLISPVIAAIPADDPDREMSKLHSVFAWGVVGVVIFCTLFLQIFSSDNWWILSLLCTAVPLVSFVLFLGADLPELQTPEKTSGALAMFKNKTLWVCVLGIFCGGAAECTMSQWCSGYAEQALGIDKIWGDVFGTALFALMLGLGRTLYSKIGKNINRVLLLGSIGAVICYIVSAISLIPLIGLAACALTGFCVSMLWPGSLISVTDRIPSGGVFIFAIMAAGGDLGASVGPQMVGVVTDAAMTSPTLISLAQSLALQPEQLSMRLGMLIGTVFPIIGVIVFAKLLKDRKRIDKEKVE